MTTDSVAAPKLTSACATPSSLRSAPCSLSGAVGAVHAGDVQQAALRGVRLRRRREVERPVLVHGEGAVVLAVRGRADAARQADDVVVAQEVLVVRDVEEAASEVRLDGVDALEAEQLAADLVDAARALALARQDEGEVDGCARS